ncbi:MAG: fatty acid desaturase [Gemmobacter sp.]|nr:fatty acid desaturase [Gemmobacter sp.]
MNAPTRAPAATLPQTPRDWVQVLARYREPILFRSVYELAVSLVPFVALWGLAWWSIAISPWLALGISVLNAGFLLRLFLIQHDCGHGSFFANRRVSDWVGRILGTLTLTPYEVWRRAHSIHHSTAGNLDKRGVGDITTLTVAEYNALSPLAKLQYRAYRHPLVMFGIGPGYMFLLQNRLPVGFMRAGRKYWISAMGTNLSIAAMLGLIVYFGGWAPVLLIFLPSVIVASTIGIWLFYVQHQFEDTVWDNDSDWQLHDAALHGSTHYDLPGVMRWFSANIGIHHVHHLYSRIPFYRLTEVLRDHPTLADIQRLTLRESLGCVKLNLWDEAAKRMVSFAQARSTASA